MDGIPHNAPLPLHPHHYDTLNIAPSERRDVIVNCNNPGTGAFHYGILLQAEADQRLYGIMTALTVQ